MNNNLYAIILLINVINIYQSDAISHGKACVFNEAIFDPKIFHYNAYWKCYENFSERKQLQKVYCLVEHDGVNFTVPSFVVREKCVPFDYKSSSISDLVQSSLSNETYDMWIKCCQDAEHCCKQMTENYNGENFFNTCDAHWDGLNCFRETNPGDFVEKPCPYHMSKHEVTSCKYSYSKICQHNGTWTTSDFSQCYQNKRLRNFIGYHLGMSSLALLFCLPPILSIMLCKSSRGKHLKTFVGLIVFVTLRGALKLALVSLISTDSMTLTANSFTCKTLVALTHFTGTMSYAFLSLIALKLLQIGRNVASGSWGLFMLMSLTLLFSIVSTILWAFARKIFSNHSCWMDEDGFSCIYYLVRVVILLIAILFLGLCIFNRSGDNNHIELFTKVMTICLVLFILPILVNIMSSMCGWNDIYNFTQESLELLQVISICIIYFIPFHKNLAASRMTYPMAKSSSQNSRISLTSSRTSYNRDDISSNWLDVIRHPNSIACYENEIIYENVSNLPEPYKTEPLCSNESGRSSVSKKRSTIRQVMLRAKKEEPQNDLISHRTCIASPIPIPKIIPNQILDDVQLFDAYYKSLDSPQTHTEPKDQNRSHKEASKRISMKNIGKVFMSKNVQHTNLGAASNDD